MSADTAPALTWIKNEKNHVWSEWKPFRQAGIKNPCQTVRRRVHLLCSENYYNRFWKICQGVFRKIFNFFKTQENYGIFNRIFLQAIDFSVRIMYNK